MATNVVYFGYVEYGQRGITGYTDCKHSHSIGSINGVVNSQHKTERCSNTNKDDNNVHGNIDKARVIDVEVFDISALIGQKQTTNNQNSFIHI